MSSALDTSRKFEEFILTVFGVSGVGKSCVTVQYLQNTFLEAHDPTIEDCYTITREVQDVPCHIKVYDTAGQEEYSALRPHYMREGEGFLLVYSIIDAESFAGVQKLRDQIIMAKEEDTITGRVPMVLIGNKCDLEEQGLRAVPTADGQRVAQQWGIPFMECSAKTRINIDEAFVALINEVRKDRKIRIEKEAELDAAHQAGRKRRGTVFKCSLL